MIALLVFVAPFASLVTLTHGHDGSTTASSHYFEGIVLHFPLYSPYDGDYGTSITAV